MFTSLRRFKIIRQSCALGQRPSTQAVRHIVITCLLSTGPHLLAVFNFTTPELKYILIKAYTSFFISKHSIQKANPFTHLKMFAKQSLPHCTVHLVHNVAFASHFQHDDYEIAQSNQPTMVTANHSIYCLPQQLTRQLTNHTTKPSSSSQLAVTDSDHPSINAAAR